MREKYDNQQVMITEPLKSSRARLLDLKWSRNNTTLDFFVPKPLKNKLTVEEIRQELRGVGHFIDEAVIDSFHKFPISPEEMATTLCVGVPQGGVGINWLEAATKAESQLVFVDVSSVGCRSARKILSAQERRLVRKGVEAILWSTVQGDIRDLLEDPDDYGLFIPVVKRLVLPLVLGYLGYRPAGMVLEAGGEILSQANNPRKNNAVVFVGQLQDNQSTKEDGNKPRHDPDRGLWFYRRDEILSAMRSTAGRKLVVAEERKYIYFQEVVTALTIVAK